MAFLNNEKDIESIESLTISGFDAEDKLMFEMLRGIRHELQAGRTEAGSWIGLTVLRILPRYEESNAFSKTKLTNKYDEYSLAIW